MKRRSGFHQSLSYIICISVIHKTTHTVCGRAEFQQNSYRKKHKNTHHINWKLPTTPNFASVSGLHTNLHLWLYVMFWSSSNLPRTPPPLVTKSSSGGHGWRVSIMNWLPVKINFMLWFYVLSNEDLCQWDFGIQEFVNVHTNQTKNK